MLKLTIATGSLLRVAARLNVFTCVLVSRAFANSFSVGIGIFYSKKTNPVIRKASHTADLNYYQTAGVATTVSASETSLMPLEWTGHPVGAVAPEARGACARLRCQRCPELGQAKASR